MRRAPLVRWSSLVVLAAFATGRLARPPQAASEDAPAKPDDGGQTPKVDREKTRGYVGITYGLAQKMTADERKEAGIKVEKGLVVQHVMLDGPAMSAGVEVGDVPVSLNGATIPPTKDLATDDETWKKFNDEKFKPLFEKINPGEKVAFVVDRAGKPLTFQIVSMNFEEKERLALLDGQDQAAVKPPKIEGRGAPKAGGFTFEEPLPEEKLAPKDLLQMTGYWEVQEDAGKPGNHVIKEGSDYGDMFNVGLLVGDGHVYADGTASLRFSLLLEQGERSKSAGIVVRCQDRRHYYALRVDGVAQNIAIVKIEKEEQTILAKKKIESPKLGTWHTFSVSFRGKALEATFDGTTTVTASDASYTKGWVGLASYADAVTLFDDFEVKPADGAPPAPAPASTPTPTPEPTPTK